MRLAFLASCFVALTALAQPPNTDCSTAALTCAQQPLTGTNTGANAPLPAFCQPGANQVWYTFFTNSQGGTVDVAITSIDCPLVAGMDDELSLAVLAGDANCNPALFSAVMPCTSGSAPFVGTTLALAANTQYWVVVAGVQNGGATIPAQCDFSIVVSGPGANVVGVDFDAGPDVEIAEGAAVQLNVTGGTNWNWSPTAGLSGNGIPNPIANPQQPTAYAVSTQLNGCTYTDTVYVEVIQLIDPPNTFTPNGDGMNDTWEVPGIADYPGSEVIIYDRWGQKVFNSNGYREPWDGTNNGRPLSEGTYYYFIQLNEVEGRSAPYLGFVSIIR
ncbi:MAG: gliding motility-associated C-terminal domain-containing protein [Flavobacteriales bacterium]|nr:gliding motility-associated C-terminal domain-containing protein [Flavobacteriales bacterium]